ncbi:uncharacterized protein LOC110008439 [Amborella trichopoda]|uniref:uncharacterized protein LOC110008439 n=1 Tax=Amborella trichopoda TaxID=13333 RepID=UPI0009C000AB|nr:uncharacterized protein LOC110008439 [Amborella trichopoda]|eukprot:XP_020531521.1 uncharacterized protein LOC110008439 [Amborella trichopoda]
MRVFSNDRIESVIHKVLVSGEDRYSAVLAIEPARNVIIEPLEEFVNEENPPKYKAFMWEKLSTSRKLSEFVKSDVETMKVILVGHDFGGACISYAMEAFPQKVAKAVFVAAAM